jgi:hypothetical protein
MNNIERRIQTQEKRFIPSREATERNQKMWDQIAAGRERLRKYRELHGDIEESDEGLPPMKVHTSRGAQLIIDRLHEGRDRCRLRAIRDGLISPSGSLAKGDISCQ